MSKYGLTCHCFSKKGFSQFIGMIPNGVKIPSWEAWRQSQGNSHPGENVGSRMACMMWLSGTVNGKRGIHFYCQHPVLLFPLPTNHLTNLPAPMCAMCFAPVWCTIAASYCALQHLPKSVQWWPGFCTPQRARCAAVWVLAGQGPGRIGLWPCH